MAQTNKALTNEWLDFFRENANLQQFGQSDDESTFNGATGCTHTILQLWVKAKTGRLYSQDEISKIAGYPWPTHNHGMRGMQTSTDPNSELRKVLRHFGIPAVPIFYSQNLTETIFQWLNRLNNLRGPVGVAVKYDWYPEHRGTIYNGIRADGRPNGFAYRNGKTQLAGFYGPHFTCRLGYDKADNGQWYGYWREPNHGSPSRPERPGWDQFLTRYERPLIQSYRRLLIRGVPRSLMFVYPTARWAPR